MEHKPIELECILNGSPSKVWKALIDKEEMKKWYFRLEEFKAETGFRFQFTGGPSPEKQYVHICEITEVTPEEKLTYSWRYEGYPGVSYVSFELFPSGDKTLLKLTHTGLETFPEDNPDFAIRNFKEGWDKIINTSLKGYIEGETKSA